MKGKKITAVVLSVLLALLVVSGCGSGGEGEAGDSKLQNTGLSGKLTLALFQGGYGSEYWSALIEKFEEYCPNVRVEAEINPQIGEMLRPKMLSGDSPDFIYLSQGQQGGLTLDLIKEHALLPLDDVFEAASLDKEGTNQEILLNGILETSFYKPYGDGKIYLAPLNTSPCGMIYNKTLFEEKGWEVPETWEEFFALGDRAREEGRYLFTFPSANAPGYCNQLLLPAMGSAVGREGLDAFFRYEAGSFSSPKVMRILEHMERLAREYTLPGTSALNHSQAQAQMALGRALFIPNGIWIENEMLDTPKEGGEKFRFALLPCLKLEKDDPTVVSLQPEQVYIPKEAKNPEAAKEFLKFLYTDESVRLFGKYATGVIATKNAVDLIKDSLTPSCYAMCSVLADPSVTAFCQSYRTPPSNSSFAAVKNIFEDGLRPMFQGELTAKEWTLQTEEMFEAVRAEYEREEGGAAP